MSAALQRMMADCPSCGGWGDHGADEDGRLYACCACGASGRVDAAVAAEYRRSAAWSAYAAAERQIERRVAYGVPAGCRFYINDDGEAVVIAPRSPAAHALIDDDLPF